MPESFAGFPKVPVPVRKLTKSVPDVAVTMHTRKHVTAGFFRQHGMNEIPVATQTSILSHSAISGFDLDRFVKILQGERQRVKEPVVRLGDPLAQKVVRQMAIVADGDVPMPRVQPGIVVILHDVAIRAGQRIIAQITGALTIAKGEYADTAENPQHGEEHGRKQGSAHNET